MTPVSAALIGVLAAMCHPQLCPPPKHVQWIGSAPAGTVIILGGESEQARFARSRFRRLLNGWGADGPTVTVRLVEAASAAQVTAAARAAGLPAPPADIFPQSYVIVPAGRRELRVIAGSAGLIYGADTAAQLFADGRVHLARISDWPTFWERGYTGCARDLSEDQRQRLRMLTNGRLNAVYYEIYADRGQDHVPPEVEDVARECRRRSIFLYGLISNWRTIRMIKRPMCASRQEDLDRVRRWSRELLDRGCEGLIFLFDDIPGSQVVHVEKCPQCKARFKTLARLQTALAEPMFEVGRKRGVRRFMLCPTPYFRGWQNCYGGRIKGCDYFREWGAAPQLKDVGIYHCVVRPSELKKLFDCGLRNYVYWYNGGYNYFRWAPTHRAPKGAWDGLTDLAYGWYLCRWDRGKGVVPAPDAYQALRALPKYTRRAWMCNGGEFRWLLWGTYLWAADAADEPELRTLAVGRLYGQKAAQAYLAWEAVVRQGWAKALSTNFTDALRGAEQLVSELKAAAARARAAAEDFAAAIRQPQWPKPTAPPERLQRDAELMASTADALLAEAERLARGDVTIEVDKTSIRKTESGATVRETRITLRRGLFTYLLRYSQTIEKDGRKHRTRWHFGAGLGMLGPSNRNWYDAGFIDLVLDGKSLDAWTPEISVGEHQGQRCLTSRWSTGRADVVMDLWPRADGGLAVVGEAVPKTNLKSAELRLWCIPSAGMWDTKDMDKAVVTPSGTFPHGKAVSLKPGERWIFYMDRTYDVPHKGAEGPCAVVFLDPAPAGVSTDNGHYVVTTTARLDPQRPRFSIVLYDFHGLKNSEALELLRRRLLAGLGITR